MPKELVMSKQKLIIHTRITSTGYIMTEMTVNHIISKYRKLA